jgi:hypothetical protein
MNVASAARPPLVLAGLALGGLAVGLAVRAPAPEVVPEPQIICRIPSVEAVPEPLVPDVPGNARYWSIDMDGDGQPELIAVTGDQSEAIVVHYAGETPIATIPLRFPGNPCDSDLGIEDGRLTAHDRGGENCEETATRRFRIRDGQLSTVTVTDTKITIVDN